MNIKHLKLNHLTNPLGYDVQNPTISYVVEDAAGKHQVSAKVQVSLKEEFFRRFCMKAEQMKRLSIPGLNCRLH